MADLVIARDIVEEQATGSTSHQLRLVFNGCEARRDILHMGIVGETNERYILGHTQSYCADRCERSKGDNVVESKDSIWTFRLQKHLLGSLHRQLIVNRPTCHQVAVDGDARFSQCFKITVFPPPHHIKVIGTTDKSYAPATSRDKVFGG